MSRPATFVVALAVFTVSCGGVRIESPEGKTAYYADQVMKSIIVAQDAVFYLTAQNILPPTDGVAIMSQFKKAGELGQQLAGILAAIDNQKEWKDGEFSSKLTLVSGLLQQISSLINSALISVKNPEAKDRLVALVDGIQKTIITVSMELAKSAARR